ncbi:MAG: hypothetical protein HQK83_14575 [Fibrobacteria bacterium]|nr:hypothetical protein [Fibrobacteria bacterium]
MKINISWYSYNKLKKEKRQVALFVAHHRVATLGVFTVHAAILRYYSILFFLLNKYPIIVRPVITRLE